MSSMHRARASKNNTGGNLMSSNKGALRRLTLLAGSSLIAVSLNTAALTGGVLLPTLAHAANECDPIGVDPSANGDASDSYACSLDTYETGITYSSDGDLSVAATAPFTEVQVEGVNLTGNDADDVTWDSTAGAVSGSFGATTSTGAVLDVTSDTGDISVTANGVGASNDSNTHAIRATSTGGGDIAIAVTGQVDALGAASVAAIEATSVGGDVTITTSGAEFFDTTYGRLRGIIARSGGAGEVTLNLGAQLLIAPGADQSDAIVETEAGAGATTINLTSGTVWSKPDFFTIDHEAIAIRASSASTSADDAVSIQNSGATIYGAVDFSGVTAGGVTFNNSGTGRWEAGGASVFGAGNDTLIFGSELQDTVSSQMPQNKVHAGASIDFGAGNDLLDVQTGLNIGNLSTVGALLDFGAGVDTVSNAGSLSIDGPVTFANLETFNNSETLYLGAGAFLSDSIIDFSSGDIGADDVLTMPGATFTGSGLSRIVAAVHFDTSTQEGCDAQTGAADCLFLPDGATAGSTLLRLINAGPDATQGAFNSLGVTIVDVSGGTSAASHFALDPNSNGYIVDPTYGPVIGRPGLFLYRVVYDPDTQRHMIVGLPRSEALEYVVLGSAAQSIWYMTSQAVTDRQTDLREGTAGSLWMKVSGEYSKRDVSNTIDAHADSFDFDNSYKLYAGTLMAGMDFIAGDSGGYDYVLGAQIGYVGSTFDLEASPSSGQMTGATGGVYGSVWNGALFLDGTFNTNFLTLDYDAPGIGSKTTTWVRSVGAQLEGGSRFMLGEKLFAEPLATLAFVNTAFEEISLDGGEVTPDDASSQRAALGLRLGADLFGGPLKVRYFVAGRAWNEFSGENEGVVFNPGADLPFAEDTSGAFGEAQAGLSLFNDDQTIAGFLTSGVKFKDGYNAVDLDLGLRLRW